MDHDLGVCPGPPAVAARAASHVAGLARAAVAAGSRFAFGVSGGQTPSAMFRALGTEGMPWASGLGPDGHTAPLVPVDPVLDETRGLLAVTWPCQGHRR